MGAGFKDDSTPINPQRAAFEIDTALPADSNLVSDIGVHLNWLLQYCKPPRPDSHVGCMSFGAMGFGAMGFGVAGVPGAKSGRSTMSCVFIGLLPLLGIVLWPFAANAQADGYPSRSIRLVVPYAAGGIADLLARTVSQPLAPELGQSIIVENQAGAGGHLGANAVVRAPHDGYTLVLATIAHNAASSMYANLGYNPEKDLKPVILIAESAGVLVVNAALPPKSVHEFIAYAKSATPRPSYGSAGHGSAIHLAAELFKSMAAVDLTHVPYRGSAPAMTDLLSGNIQVMFENIPTALQHIRAGGIRPLGVTSPKRSHLLPETPVIADVGVPGYAAVPWYTISVASSVPAEVVAKLNKAINAVLVRPDLAQRWSDLGVTPLGGSPQDAEKRNAEETRRWSAVIKSAGIAAQ